MFLVKVKIDRSSINGIGLFADKNIPKNTKVYASNENLDLFLTNEEFMKLDKNEQGTIKHYGYFDRKKGKWHLAFDNIRFCNHSHNSNLTLRNGELFAKKDIFKDEEITQDYSEFEELREDLQS